MIDRRSVEIVIDQLKPQFQFDGGDINLTAIHEDGTVEISLAGLCGGCYAAPEHIKYGVETELKKWVPEVKRVVVIETE